MSVDPIKTALAEKNPREIKIDRNIRLLTAFPMKLKLLKHENRLIKANQLYFAAYIA